MSETRRVVRTILYIPSETREIRLNITHGHALAHLRFDDDQYGYYGSVYDVEGGLIATFESEIEFPTAKAARIDFQKTFRISAKSIVQEAT